MKRVHILSIHILWWRFYCHAFATFSLCLLNVYDVARSPSLAPPRISYIYYTTSVGSLSHVKWATQSAFSFHHNDSNMQPTKSWLFFQNLQQHFLALSIALNDMRMYFLREKKINIDMRFKEQQRATLIYKCSFQSFFYKISDSDMSRTQGWLGRILPLNAIDSTHSTWNNIPEYIKEFIARRYIEE